MLLCTFSLRGEGPHEQRVGVVRGSKVFELEKRTSMLALVQEGDDVKAMATLGGGNKLADVVLGAPLSRPGKILATIVNTQAMLGGKDVALDRPRIDMKAPSTVIGPGENVLAPKTGVRPEVELAAVVGRRLAAASPAEARSAIFGYTVLNDVTAPSDSRDDAYDAYRRDQASGEIRKAKMRGPLFRSKNHDTFCPMGPWIATLGENKDWSSLRMTTRFEGTLVQDGSTSEYIFSPEQIASYVSGFLTLEPGDVVSCGSVGWTPEALRGLDPTEFILPRRGGVLEVEIQGVGKLQNPVVYRDA
jgi:2-keto-4-pentenoate hydratase/2-oxohepta-3-ene-1,7-dioic acid hydratase in catechol pathway